MNKNLNEQWEKIQKIDELFIKIINDFSLTHFQKTLKLRGLMDALSLENRQAEVAYYLEYLINLKKTTRELKKEFDTTLTSTANQQNNYDYFEPIALQIEKKAALVNEVLCDYLFRLL